MNKSISNNTIHIQQQIKSLSDHLWSKATINNYISQALNTKFIQQMKQGILHPEHFGAFMIQDYQYQEQAAVLFQEAYEGCLQKGQHQIMEMIEPFKSKYRKRADQHFKSWRMRKNMAILSPAFEAYVRLCRQKLKQYGGIYVFILQYSCRRLWPDLANAIKGNIPIETNAYRFWIERYQFSTPESKMSLIIDKLHQEGKLDAQICWRILEQCLVWEVNVLKEPFEEQFLSYRQLERKCISIAENQLDPPKYQKALAKTMEMIKIDGELQ